MRNLPILLSLLLATGCGDKDDDETPDDSGLYGGDDGADGDDGTDGSDGTDGGADGTDGTDGGDPSGISDCVASDGEPASIGAPSISGDTLTVEMHFSGCDTGHDFTLCWPDPIFAESYPVQVWMEVRHDGPAEDCDAVFTQHVDFDLSSLRETYQDDYATTSGDITIHLSAYDGSASSVTYSF